MNKSFLIYNESGFIVAAGKCPQKAFDAQVSVWEGCSIMEGDGNPADHYVDTSADPHVIKEKISLDCSYSQNNLSVLFDSLPAGTKVRVKGQILTVDGDTTDIQFDVPGNYRISIDPPVGYKAERLEVAVG